MTDAAPDPPRRAGAGSGARLVDVAERAGVSVKTVSNVVNGYVHVSAATRGRVEEALRALGYRPNQAARNLRSGSSGIVGLAVPELDFPYFAELAGHIVAAARDRGWTVLIDQTDGELDRELLAMDSFGTQLLDGLIVSPLASGADDFAARRDTTPMVLLGERVYDGPSDHVSIDNVAASRSAVDHLLSLGRTRVAAVGGIPPVPGSRTHAHGGTSGLRATGYVRALESAGLAVDPRLMVPATDFRRADGAAAVDVLWALPDPPDALFCFNDLLALGAIRRLLERGLRVPDDVAVVGIDDIEDGRFATPSLTTVRPDKVQIARLAVQLLADRLCQRPRADVPSGSTAASPLERGPSALEQNPSPRELLADFELMPRESTLGRS